jgi:hypothetical protein
VNREARGSDRDPEQDEEEEEVQEAHQEGHEGLVVRMDSGQGMEMVRMGEQEEADKRRDMHLWKLWLLHRL